MTTELYNRLIGESTEDDDDFNFNIPSDRCDPIALGYSWDNNTGQDTIPVILSMPQGKISRVTF
jgi:hypothetical protein